MESAKSCSCEENDIKNELSADTSLKERPFVTFALFVYNQEKYIREAVEGAFSQTYEPLEIILSDDCSTDRTFNHYGSNSPKLTSGKYRQKMFSYPVPFYGVVDYNAVDYCDILRKT
jgi:hypothetical protein